MKKLLSFIIFFAILAAAHTLTGGVRAQTCIAIGPGDCGKIDKGSQNYQYECQGSFNNYCCTQDQFCESFLESEDENNRKSVNDQNDSDCPTGGIAPDGTAATADDLAVNFKCIAEQFGLPKGLRDIGGITSTIIPIFFTLSGLVLFVYLIMAGFGYLTSAGDPKKVEGAKGRITNALLGFIIIFVAYWLVQIAQFIFGLNEVTLF